MEQQAGRPKLKAIDRGQGCWAALRPEDLIGRDHPGRIIWQLSAGLDLAKLESGHSQF